MTHYGWGTADVKQVASNRRILGADGRVRAERYTATKDPALRAEPEGTIDPQVSLLSFWSGDRPLAVLSYYACHPQSYYRTGVPSPDFPGIARFIRGQAVPEALHVHFDGGGGNIGAGKYNDGAKENRMALAERLAEGMGQAWTATQRHSLSPDQLGWRTVPVRLPVAPHLQEAKLVQAIKTQPARGPIAETDQLAWLKRAASGRAIEVSLPARRYGPRALHAGRAVRRIPTRGQGHAPRFARGGGRVRRFWSRLHRHGGGLSRRRIRNEPPNPAASMRAPEPILMAAMKRLLEAK